MSPWLRGAAILLVTLALAGCGGTAPEHQTASADGAFPVSVQTKFGTTTINQRPVRVVAMTWADADFALSLGVVPVGIGRANYAPTELQPWATERFGGQKPVVFDSRDGAPVERVASLRPDIILATKDFRLDDSYVQLSRVAPVVGYLNGPNNDTWQHSLQSVATALGRADEGKRVVQDTEGWMAAQKVAHPELADKTFAYVIASDSSVLNTVNSTDDVSAGILTALGLRLSPTVLGLPTGSIPGRAPVSGENLGVVDADVLIGAGTQPGLAGLERHPVFVTLPSVRRGAFVPIDNQVANALAYPTPLSLRWALPRLIPHLSDAAKR